MKIAAGAFQPTLVVSSALVSMRLPGERTKLPLADEAGFLEFVKLCFGQKRKTVVNNLRAIAEPDATRKALEQQALRVDARAEQLSVAQLAALRAAIGTTT